MSPVEGQSIISVGSVNMTNTSGGGSISLATLIEFIIQRTYHELTVLSELLPRKTDMERKIEIAQFAHRTRQLFVRLLALIRWTNSASKVEKCARICSFLQTQQLLFIETADMLSRLARETLVHARLPSFSLPCAVDVLTMGTYPRLPACIKEKIIPQDPISAIEKRQTLERINQIIEHRVVMTDLLQHMCRPMIEDGRVKFRIEHEFEVTLTLMGDGAHVPWRLLDIEILVEDPETGDGQSLVHSLQVNYIHQIIQTRLIDNDRPLHDLYNCLHTFCQSLQLEVLHSQAQSLMRQRLGDNIRVEEYIPSRRLTLSYWRDAVKKEGRPYQQAYKLNVQVDETDVSKPLQITHFPQVQGSESTKVPLAIQSDCLSVEKFLMKTIQVRSLAKLKDLERELRVIISLPCEIKELQTVLYVSILTPCLDHEKLCITVDILKGCFLVSLAQNELVITSTIEETLNSDKKDLRKLITNLRIWLILQRCRKSLNGIHVVCFDHLPFNSITGHALDLISNNRLYVKLPLQPAYYLVVEVADVLNLRSDQSQLSYYILSVKSDNIVNDEDSTIDVSGNTSTCTMDQISSSLHPSSSSELYRFYLTPGHMLRLDKSLASSGSCGRLFDADLLSRKRKATGESQSSYTEEILSKRFRSFDGVSELTRIVALCADRLPLVALADELDQRSLRHTGLRVDGDGVGMCLSILEMLPTTLSYLKSEKLLRSSFVSLTFRVQRTDRALWLVEVVFSNPVIRTTHIYEQGTEQRVCLTFDKLGTEPISKLIDSLLNEWNAIAQLFAVVVEFAEAYEASIQLQRDIEVRSYTFKRITLAYGPNKAFTMHVHYSQIEHRFIIVFGSLTTIPNYHSLVVSYAERDLDKTKSLALIAKMLSETSNVVMILSKFNTTPVAFLKQKPQFLPQPTFTVIAESAIHFRVIYRNHNCIDIQCKDSCNVLVRDGAYSVFDSSKVVDGINPVPGLQAFLSLFVDESVSSGTRHRSTTEDDNPPSPVGVDMLESFLNMPQQNNITGIAGTVGMSVRQTTGIMRADMMSTASPSNQMAQSPINQSLPVPSPSSFNVSAPSPGSLPIHMPSPSGPFVSPQGMVEGGSPYTSTGMVLPSPGQQRNWPNSPSTGPGSYKPPGGRQSPKDDQSKSALATSSRMLPQRAWAASIPTLFSHDALDRLLTPTIYVSSTTSGQSLMNTSSSGQTTTIPCCPLERFLGCVYLRRHMLRNIQSEENQLTQLPCTEPGVIMFKIESGLQFRLGINPQTLQSLRLKVSPVPDYPNQWDPEELLLLEKFFDAKVACPPYKPNEMSSFAILLRVQQRILKDFIQIMKLELMPERNMRWVVQWCLTIPHGWPPLAPDHTMGSTGIVVGRKILFMLQLTRVVGSTATPAAAAADTAVHSATQQQAIIVPILYDTITNQTQTVEQKSTITNVNNAAVVAIFKNFAEYNQKPTECSIYPAIKELLNSLNI